MILGFDASTKAVGWCKLEDDGTYVDMGYVDISKCDNLYKKMDEIEKFLKDFSRKDVRIVVEAPLPRSNNQNVVNLLQRWNGIFCAALYSHFRKSPELVAQREALKKLNIKIPKGVKGEDRKKFILQSVKDLKVAPDSKWENNRNGNPHKWCYDQADAFVVARSVI